MSETKFTPGPWHWNASGPKIALITENDMPVLLPTTDGFTKLCSLSISQADMNLIAAAPDLYEALEELVSLVRNLPVPESSTREERYSARRIYINAELALAKACGVTSDER